MLFARVIKCDLQQQTVELFVGIDFMFKTSVENRQIWPNLR